MRNILLIAASLLVGCSSAGQVVLDLPAGDTGSGEIVDTGPDDTGSGGSDTGHSTEYELLNPHDCIGWSAFSDIDGVEAWFNDDPADLFEEDDGSMWVCPSSTLQEGSVVTLTIEEWGVLSLEKDFMVEDISSGWSLPSDEVKLSNWADSVDTDIVRFLYDGLFIDFTDGEAVSATVTPACGYAGVDSDVWVGTDGSFEISADTQVLAGVLDGVENWVTFEVIISGWFTPEGTMEGVRLHSGYEFMDVQSYAVGLPLDINLGAARPSCD